MINDRHALMIDANLFLMYSCKHVVYQCMTNKNVFSVKMCSFSTLLMIQVCADLTC